MNVNFNIPAIVQQKMNLSAEVLKAWKSAVWTVKQGQEKFVNAYRLTLDHVIPSWKDNWKTDPTFSERLNEVEEVIKSLCRDNGMGLTVWNKYRSGARKAVLMDVPFKFAVHNNIEDLREIQTASAESEEKGEAVAKDIRKRKQVKGALSTLRGQAAVIPLPVEGEHQDDYIESVTKKLTEFMAVVKDRYGEAGVTKLRTSMKTVVG